MVLGPCGGRRPLTPQRRFEPTQLPGAQLAPPPALVSEPVISAIAPRFGSWVFRSCPPPTCPPFRPDAPWPARARSKGAAACRNGGHWHFELLRLALPPNVCALDCRVLPDTVHSGIFGMEKGLRRSKFLGLTILTKTLYFMSFSSPMVFGPVGELANRVG